MRVSELMYDKFGKKRTLYSIRHFYITISLMKGFDIHIVAKQCGTSTTMIDKYYSKLIPTLRADLLSGRYEKYKKEHIDNLDFF